MKFYTENEDQRSCVVHVYRGRKSKRKECCAINYIPKCCIHTYVSSLCIWYPTLSVRSFAIFRHIKYSINKHKNSKPSQRPALLYNCSQIHQGTHTHTYKHIDGNIYLNKKKKRNTQQTRRPEPSRAKLTPPDKPDLL